MKYRIEGKEKVYSVGPYSLVGLAAARVELGEVKSLIRENKDPVMARRLSRAETAAGFDWTFRLIAEEWLTMKQGEWSAGHYAKSQRALERDIYPTLGGLSVASITPAIVAKAVKDIHKRDALETATRILQHSNGVFRYAQAKGLCRDNPAGPAREVLPRKKDGGRMPALRAYDRGERFAQRVELFNWWGEQLAAAQQGLRVTPAMEAGLCDHVWSIDEIVALLEA